MNSHDAVGDARLADADFTAPDLAPGEIGREATVRPGLAALRAFRTDVVGVVAAAVFLLLVLYAVLVPLLTPASAGAVDITNRLKSPSLFGAAGGAILGTDHLGRPLGLTVAEGLRTSLEVGLAVVIITACVGWLLGAVGAYIGGWVDSLVGRLMDTLNVFPGLLLAMAIVSALGGGLVTIILVLSIEGIVIFGRLGRSITLSGKHAEYVMASRAFGASAPRILLGHLRLTSSAAIVALALVQLPQVILLEASLSFVGFGIQPPDTSIGLIVSEERDFIAIQSWPVLFSGGCLALTCISLALIGLSVRRALRS
jgi:peptide/nickel transport system permease protein